MGVRPELREFIELEIEALIAFLDEADGDTDLEDGGDLEPSLGGYSGDDRELDQSDDEFSLGWEEKPSQVHLGFGTDLEDDNDTGFGDRDAVADPSLPIFPAIGGLTPADQQKVREVFDAARRLAWTRMGRNPDTVSLLGPGICFERKR